MRSILVTGIHGFLAGEVARAAAANDVRVVGLGRSNTAPDHCEYVRADCLLDDLAAIVRDQRPDAVFHGAGSGTIATGFTNPRQDFDASVVSFQRVLDAVRREAPDAPVVFPSSASVYGQPKTLPISEANPTRPISPYGHHKAMCEALAREYSTCFGLHISCLRIFSTFGFTQRKLLIWELAKQALTTGEVVVRGTGAEERDYLPVEDVARVALVAAEQRASHFLNVAAGRAMTVREVAEAITRGAGVTAPIRYLGQSLAGNPTSWCADVQRLSGLVKLPKRDLLAEIAALTGRWRESAVVESSG